MQQKGFYIHFFNFLNVCWVYGDIPQEWRTAIVIPVHKKGDRNNPDNNRGISLLNTGYKIYLKIIAKRLTAIAEFLLLNLFTNYCKEINCNCRVPTIRRAERNLEGRSCMDCIFTASQIIEKHREFNIPTYIAFIDFKKAFDSVDREIMDYYVK